MRGLSKEAPDADRDSSAYPPSWQPPLVPLPTLLPTARTRLQALEMWQRTGDWRLAAQVFGLARATLFR